MPTYVVHAAAEAFDTTQRDALVEAITGVHNVRTGAPRSFVQTIFLDIPAGSHYIGGKPTDPRGVWVYVNELAHTDMVEFGSVLPVPGDEGAWIEGLDPAIRDHLRALD